MANPREDVPTGVEWLLELEAIRQLKHRYMRALDQNHWDELGECLADDVTCSYAAGAHTYTGREAVLEFLRSTTVAAPTTSSSHVASQPVIEILSADRAVATWRLTDIVQDRASGSVLFGAAEYSDSYVKTTEGWRIASTGYERLLEHRLDR